MNYRTVIGLILLSLSVFSNSFAQNNTALSDTIDVIHYAIHLDVIDVESHQISGYTEVEFTTPLDSFDQLILELKDLTVTQVKIDDLDYSFVQANNRITVNLTDSYANGEVLTAKVYYEGEPFHEGWGGFHYSGSRCFNLGVGFESDPHNLGKAWFPCVDDFRDRALYDYYITVAENNKAVCGGLLQETTDNGDGTKTFHWKMQKTIPTYLASIAVGEYELVSDVYQGMNGEIPINYWVYPSQVNQVAGSFANMHAILDAYESCWGPYPFSRVGYVSTSLGAMEHAGNIAYPSNAINGNTSMEWLFAHELSHMWFGDKVTCSSAENMWMNEGWAVYNESMSMEFLYGVDVARENINVLLKDVLTKAHTDNGDGAYYALYGIPTTHTYGMTVYDKGGLVTHTLRHYMGDELFFPAVRAYLEAYQYQYANSWDLRDFLSNHSGMDLTDFFDAWVFSPGFPAFQVDSSHYNNGVATVFVSQKLRGAPNMYNSNHLDISFLDENWNIHTEQMVFSGETGQASFSLDFEPLLVLVDYYDHIADATTDKDFVIKDALKLNFDRTYFKADVQQITDSAFVRVSHNWVAPDVDIDLWQGITISDSRYWRIEAVLPETFECQGQFYFNSMAESLDKSLFANNEGEVTLLYREGPGHAWRPIPFTLLGPGIFGHLITENLLPGEYTIGIINENYIKVGSNYESKSKLFPNPSSTDFKIELKDIGCRSIKIYNEQGKLIDTLNDLHHGTTYEWKPTGSKGAYYFLFLDENGKMIAHSKALYI